MNDEDKILQKIEEYLRGELHGTELASFKEQLVNDVELREKLHLSQLADELVIEHRLTDVSSILQEEHARSSQTNSWKNPLLTLTGVLLLSGGAYLLMKRDQPQDKVIQINGKITEETGQATTSKETRVEEHSVTFPEFNSSKTSISPVNSSIPKQIVSTENPDTLESFTPEPVEKPTTPTDANAVVPATPSPCKDIEISTRVSVIETCLGENEGAILLSEIKGGHPPYNVETSKGEHIYHSAQHLAEGSYHISITDAKGCRQEFKNIQIPEKNCPKDYSFNPFMGESWQIPVYKAHGTLTIADKAGKVYFHKEIQANTEEIWNGYSTHGELEAGYYIFTITYTDGSYQRGSITLVR